MNGWSLLILILALLPLVLISVPLTFEAGGCLRPEERRLKGRLSWGLGLLAAVFELNEKKVSFGLRLAGLALPIPRRKPETKKARKTGRTGKAGKKPGRRERPGFSFSAIIAVFNRQLLTVILEYVRQLYKSLRLKLRLSGVYGTDDPALTGLLAGLTAALPSGHHNLNLEADFDGPHRLKDGHL